MRTTKLLLVLVLFSVTAAVQAQTYVWEQHAAVNYTLNPTYITFPISLDEGNNRIYDSRLVNNALVFGVDIYGEYEFESRDLNGTVVWSLSIGPKAFANHITTDSTGNTYLSGNFLDTLYIGATDTLFNTGSGLNNNSYIVKLDGNGTVLWKRNVSQAWPNINDVSVTTIDPFNNCWYGFTDFFEASFVQLDSAGNDSLMHTIENAKTIGRMSFDPWGGLYISGSASSGYFIMDADTFNVTEPYNMFVARYNAAGNPQWATFAHDVTFQFPQVIADGTGGAFVTGSRYDTTSFGSIFFNHPHLSQDYFVTRTDSNGVFQWGLQQPALGIGPYGQFEPGNNLHSAVDGSGNLYFSGVQHGPVDWGGVLTSATPGLSDYRIGVAKIDKFGKAQWVKVDGSTSLNQQSSIVTTANGECFITGLIGDTASFDSLQIVTSNLRNFVVAKIDNIPTGIQDHPGDSDIAFYTTSGTFLNINDKWTDCQLEIFDSRGALVKKIKSLNDSVVSLSDLRPALYIVRLAKGDKSVTGKFIKQ
ncbi:MAG TPA: T9SS type A sorting domain-containing protein [Bacteroidia bacterium]|nr:T9SS type A sorting domain-containing protein [Bacteroidia bacterium]